MGIGIASPWVPDLATCLRAGNVSSTSSPDAVGSVWRGRGNWWLIDLLVWLRGQLQDAKLHAPFAFALSDDYREY